MSRAVVGPLFAVALVATAACGRTIEIGFEDDGGLGGDASSGDASSGDASGSETGVGAGGPGATNGSGAGQGAGPSSGPGSGPGSGSGASGTGGTGPGSGASSGSGGTICPSLGDPCTDCISTGCADVWCQCAGNPDCLGLFGCTSQCMGDPACDQACLTLHEDGISDALLVSGCAGSTCNAVCQFGDPVDPCEECVLTDCAAQMNACLAQPSCSNLWGCLNGCPPLNVTCQQQCYQDFGDGTPTLQTVLDCVGQSCSVECQ